MYSTAHISFCCADLINCYMCSMARTIMSAVYEFRLCKISPMWIVTLETLFFLKLMQIARTFNVGQEKFYTPCLFGWLAVRECACFVCVPVKCVFLLFAEHFFFFFFFFWNSTRWRITLLGRRVRWLVKTHLYLCDMCVCM